MTRVFIVDDDHMALYAMKHALSENKDLDVTLFKNGKKCLSNLHLNPDIVVIDYFLLDMTGLQLMEQIKTYNENIDTLIISGCASMAVVIEAIKNGAVAYIVKDKKAMIKLNETINNLTPIIKAAKKKISG